MVSHHCLCLLDGVNALGTSALETKEEREVCRSRDAWEPLGVCGEDAGHWRALPGGQGGGSPGRGVSMLRGVILSMATVWVEGGRGWLTSAELG